MQEHPCKQQFEEYLKAMNEWVDATNVLQSFVAAGPLAPGEDAPTLPFEEYQNASARAEVAYEDYKEKLELYFSCVGRFRQSPKD